MKARLESGYWVFTAPQGNTYDRVTSCWSTSKSGAKHPYYLCHSKGCASYRKSIRRDVIEGEFAGLIKDLQPTEGLFTVTKRMFKDAWGQRQQQTDANHDVLRTQRRTVEKQIEGLLERIVASNSGTVIAAYEKRIDTLEKDKLVLDEKLSKQAPKQGTFEQLFEHA